MIYDLVNLLIWSSLLVAIFLSLETPSGSVFYHKSFTLVQTLSRIGVILFLFWNFIVGFTTTSTDLLELVLKLFK
jgi:hypothetical protein